MRRHLTTIAVPGLRWALGLVVLLESLHFAVSPAAAHHFARTGWPLWIRPALGWSEAAAALLFLAPRTTIVGGYALLLTFAVAVAIHFQGNDFGVGALIVYGMAVVLCITHREKVGGKAA
jgi:hypothetical protein